MIYILRIRTEEEGETDYSKQLDIINDIRREIVQSSSGVLMENRFQEILKSLGKVCRENRFWNTLKYFKF